MTEKVEEETYSVIFASLKHPVRRKILRLLTQGSKTFTEILGQVDVDSSHLSYHLESLKELVKKEDNKYLLSDFGKAAASLMSRVEEPEKPSSGSLLKRSLRELRPKWLFITMLGILILSVAANMFMQSANNQVTATFVETRYRFVGEVSDAMRGLSAMYTAYGWGPELTFWNQPTAYTNLSLWDISFRQLRSHADSGHLAMLELTRLDPNNYEHYQKVDDVFLCFLNFTEAMLRLMGDGKTTEALDFTFKLFDAVRDKPYAVSENFLNAYTYLNQVNEYSLQQASELATPIANVVKSVIKQVYDKFPWLSL